MNLWIENNIINIILGISTLTAIFFLLFIIIFIKHQILNKKYKKFMSGSDAKNLEEVIRAKFIEFENLKLETEKLKNEISSIRENLLLTYQKIGIVKYDAFRETGGKLSFVLALLDKNNNGIILNSVHSTREGCYTYLKEIIKGESFLELSEDEENALSQAISSQNYMQ